MAQDDTAQPMQMPAPDPALKKLDRFVGTWNLKGHTLDSDGYNVDGQITFEWLPGGFFLKQSGVINFMGLPLQFLEVIGYDPATQTFPSTVYSNVSVEALPYRYTVEGRDVKIRTEFGGGATYTGTFSEDGNSMSGGWRPDEGTAGPGNVAYDLTGTRAAEGTIDG
jgi:hypothetical protein